jgi:phage terminase large subunit-like protein
MTTKTKKSKVLYGDVKPRLHSPWLKGESLGSQVAELAERINQPLLEWQKLILDDMCKIDKESLFIRKTSLLLIARQSGKSHLARMRCLAGLFMFGEKDILIMSSNRAMAMKSFNIMADIIERNDWMRSQLKDGDPKKGIRRTNGDERIILASGAQLEVAAATSDGARGRTADFLWIDELREVSEAAMDAAKSVTLARKNSQRLFTSNAGDAWSTVLNSLHESCRNYPPKSLGYYEYSAPDFCDIWDRKAWAMANPSMGHLITEAAIEETIASSTADAARTETLCQWISALNCPFSNDVLEASSDSTLEMSVGAYTIFGFDVSPSRRNGSLVAGQLLPDGRIGIGILETYSSQVAIDELKMAASIKAWCDIYKPRMVCFDKYATQTIADRLANSGVVVEDVSGQQFYKACGDLLEGLTNLRVVHNGQKSLIEQFQNTAAKQNDSAWRIIKRRSSGDISAPISLAMCVTKLMIPQPKPQIYG